MTQKRKRFWPFCLCLLAIGLPLNGSAAAIDHVLQQGFPTQPAALETLTGALKTEYETSHNVTALIFYAYGLLRLAEGYATTNDIVHAAEYAKSGLFWLDEAVDLHENDVRVRYLRARVDAYLPADSGRCVVTIKDTERMLANKTKFNPTVREHILAMRYRALRNCQDRPRADALLVQIKRENAPLAHALTQALNEAPQWDSAEIIQILMPLVKGE